MIAENFVAKIEQLSVKMRFIELIIVFLLRFLK